MVTKRAPAKRADRDNWDRLCGGESDDDRRLHALKRRLGEWEFVTPERDSNIAGSSWHYDYYAARTKDALIWALKIVDWGETEDEAAEKEPEVQVVAAIKVAPGRDESEIVLELVKAYCGHSIESADEVGRFDLEE